MKAVRDAPEYMKGNLSWPHLSSDRAVFDPHPYNLYKLNEPVVL
jgi:hypothetical protein